MKAFCGLALALCCASALSAVEERAIDDQLRRSAEDGKVSVHEVIRRLGAAGPTIGKPAGTGPRDFIDTYQSAVHFATDSELAELAAVIANISESRVFNTCFSTYATAAIRRQVAQLREKPVHLEWSPTAESVPKELADAPAEFVDAWRLHRSVVAPYLAVVTPFEHSKTSLTGLTGLEADLRRVLGKPQPAAWDQLARHIWGSWCGTGSQALYHPRNRALLLSFLADGKLREAAGAVLLQVPWYLSGDERLTTSTVDLLTTLGLDWEQVMFGSLLPVLAYNTANRRAVISSGWNENNAWRLLATRGSDRTVHQCLLLRSVKLDVRDATDFLSRALGPTLGDSTNASSADGEFIRTVALSPQSRHEILLVWGEYLEPANPPADLAVALKAIPKGRVKELQEPLSALAAGSLPAVAGPARDLLKGAGLMTEDNQ